MATAEYTISKDSAGNLVHGPRTIPVPTSVSETAQAFLRDVLYPVQVDVDPPQTLDDKAGWKKYIKAINDKYEVVKAEQIARTPATVETKQIGGVTVYVATPHELRHPDRAHLSIHGGGFMLFGGTFAKALAATSAVDFGCVTFGLDYRMPPDHPYPAAVEDGVAVWREIIKQYDPKRIAVSGGSAGGSLTATITLKIRDLGLPMPGALGMMTPGTDFTRASDTLCVLDGIDNVVRSSPGALAMYAPGEDMKDPYISPLWADLSKGFPPTFLQSGTRDFLLSDTVRMHRALLKAGVHAELHVWEAMPHGGFGESLGMPPAPEDYEVNEALADFVDRMMSGAK